MKGLFKRAVLPGVLAVFNLPAGAGPAQICGNTMDETNRPVTHADVTLYSRDSTFEQHTQSNDSGEFCFRHTLDGSYLLEAKTESLHLKSATTISVRDGNAQPATLVLSISALAQQVTVTSSGLPQLADEVSKQLELVDVAEASRLGHDSLVDAVGQLPGVRVSQQGGPGSFANIQIRGLRTFDTSVLVDGMRLRDVSATQGDASSFLSDLWFTDTTRVEVLEGAGSSLYGTNAIGGIVNLVTDQGGGPLHGDADLQGGMLGQFLGRAHAAGSALRNKLLWSGGFGYVNVTEGVQDNGRYRNWGGLGSAEYVATPKIQIGVRQLGATIFGQLMDDPIPLGPAAPVSGAITGRALSRSDIPAAVNSISNGIPYSIGDATFIPAYGNPDRYRTLQFISTLGYLEQQLTPRLHYRLSVQDLDTQRNYVDGPGGLGFQPVERTSTRYGSRADTARALVEWNPIHSQIVSAGYEFENETFSSPSYIGQIPMFVSQTKASQASNTAFIQEQSLFLGDRLRVSFSGRWQKFDLSAPAFSGVFPIYASASALSPPSALTGDASIAYFVSSSGTKFRSHVGNAYRAPSLYERFGTFFDGSTFSAYGDPRLRPERALSIDLGVDQYFASDKITLSASYFYTRLQETIGYDPGILITPQVDPYGRLAGYYNTRGGVARGLEISGQMKLPVNTVVRAAYTYTNSIDRLSEFSDGQLQMPWIIPNMFTLTVLKTFGSRWDTAFELRAGSHYVYPLFESLPPFRELAYRFAAPRQASVSIGYTRTVGERIRIRPNVRLQNIGNQEYFEGGFPTPGFVARGGVQLSF